MAFDQSVVTRVHPPMQDARGLRLRWESSAPQGTTFQVYVARRLAWAGTARTAVVPAPSGRSRIDVGAVGPGEGDVDHSGSLPSAPNDRVTLSWEGGRWLGEDLLGFRVYMSAAAGGAVDYDRPVAEVPLAVGELLDGFGMGGFGGGGFGFAATSYSWTSPPLGAGTWSFAIVSFDAAGNEGTPWTGSQAILAPPEPPARAADGRRLHYTYSDDDHTVTLSWLASPG